MLHQHLQFGTEGERAVGQQHVKYGLDREAIARHEKGFAVAVVQRKGKHAAKAPHAVLAPGLPTVDDDFGVTAGMEDVAERLKFWHEFLIVVDLAVKDDRHRAVLVEQRLLAGGDVDDGKPPMGERDARPEVVAALIRPAVARSEEHTSELQSPKDLVCRLL